VILTYRYRLLPSKRQHVTLAGLLDAQRALYNAALEERIDCYRKTGKGVSYIDQCKSLTLCRRALPEMAALPVNLQRWTLKRLDDAFQGFFRRVKARNSKAGFPRFRGRGWWDSFGFGEFSGIRFDGKRLRFAGMPRGCKSGSNRRRKIKARLARLHRKIADTRSTWLHQQSAALVKRADLIAVEDLNVKNMIRHPTLARSIADASWSKFLGFLAYKAERAGVHFVRVDPRNTSQKCSGCGELVPKSLAVRIHACPHCGLVIDRDWNASLNILRAGIGPGPLNVIRQDVRAARNIRRPPERESSI
jgi:IS605 OrfB family transposase